MTEGFLDEEIDISQKVPVTFYVGEKEIITPRVNIQAKGIPLYGYLKKNQKILLIFQVIMIYFQKMEKMLKLTIFYKKDKNIIAKKDISVLLQDKLKNQKLMLSSIGKLTQLIRMAIIGVHFMIIIL